MSAVNLGVIRRASERVVYADTPLEFRGHSVDLDTSAGWERACFPGWGNFKVLEIVAYRGVSQVRRNSARQPGVATAVVFSRTPAQRQSTGCPGEESFSLCAAH